MSTPRILIIAGSDSGGGAGIQADIKTVTMLGGHAMTAITAITAQNTVGVQAVMPVPAEMVVAQIDSVVSDIGVDSVKIGMIGSPETAHALIEPLARARVPIVFDPVMVATSGAALADKATIEAFERLIDISRLITPNAPELAALVGEPVHSLAELEARSVDLADRYDGLAVVAKGGHLPGPEVTDLLVDSDLSVQRWTCERVDTRNTHGTGCTLASAIAVGLASGLRLSQAVDQARRYVQVAIRTAPGLGEGHGPLGHALGAVPWNLIHNKNR